MTPAVRACYILGMDTISKREVVSILRRKIDEVGGVAQLARAWSLSRMYVYDVLNGKRAPGPSVLSRLGIVAETVTTTTYRIKAAREKSLTPS